MLRQRLKLETMNIIIFLGGFFVVCFFSVVKSQSLIEIKRMKDFIKDNFGQIIHFQSLNFIIIVFQNMP